MRQRPTARLEVESEADKMDKTIPALEGFFGASSQERYRSDERTFVAMRVKLDPENPMGVIGIVLRLTAD
jgi:hypothetical protein